LVLPLLPLGSLRPLVRVAQLERCQLSSQRLQLRLELALLRQLLQLRRLGRLARHSCAQLADLPELLADGADALLAGHDVGIVRRPLGLHLG
jgi:hypothetical protein